METLTLMQIKVAVAAEFRIPLGDLVSNCRMQEMVRARQVVMYLARRLTPFSTPRIGQALGNRDHTTVLHGIRYIEAQRATDDALDRSITRLERALRPPLPTPRPELQLAFFDGPLFEFAGALA